MATFYILVGGYSFQYTISFLINKLLHNLKEPGKCDSIISQTISENTIHNLSVDVKSGNYGNFLKKIIFRLDPLFFFS